MFFSHIKCFVYICIESHHCLLTKTQPTMKKIKMIEMPKEEIRMDEIEASMIGAGKEETEPLSVAHVAELSVSYILVDISLKNEGVSKV